MMTDPIADFLARIRNANLIRRLEVRVRASKMTKGIATIFREQGFIEEFSVGSEGVAQHLVLRLKYDSEGAPVIEGMKRVSRPGLRIYRAAAKLPSVRRDMGVAIVSTSKGVMTAKKAQELNVGGEVLCFVW